jgi:hypothetical protein
MADYIYTGKPNTTFADISVGDKFYDLRNMVGFGALQVSAKVEVGEEVRHYIEATNLVTGQTHRIPKRDFWAYTI